MGKTFHEQTTEILKEYVEDCIDRLEKGNLVVVRGGYNNHTFKDIVIDDNCNKIAAKLIELGYHYTTNHGHGCYDYHFLKKIKL